MLNPFDSFDIEHLNYLFDKKTKWLWFLFPVVMTTRVGMITFTPSPKDNVQLRWASFKRWVVEGNGDRGFHLLMEKLRATEVLIAYSSEKPKWYPALEDLRKRLESEGISCTVIAGKKFSQNSSNNGHLAGMEVRWDDFYGCTYKASIKLLIVLKAFAAYLAVVLLIVTSGRLFKLTRIFPILFFEYVESYKRMAVSEKIIRRVDPKVVLTNGEHLQICSELMLCSRSEGKHSIWYHNERPVSGAIPILSNEIWTWNQAFSDLLKNVTPAKSDISFSIAGYAEGDYAYNVYQDSSLEDELSWLQESNKPTLLFLLDYTINSVLDASVHAQLGMELIAETAASSVDWNFLIKPRPFQNKVYIPGQEMIAPLENCRILRSNSSLGPLLSKRYVKVVAGCLTTGMFAATVSDKICIRLMVPGVDLPEPLLDNICEHARTPAELKALLENVKKGVLRFDSQKKQDFFPFRGKVVQRMSQLVCEKLGKG